MGNKIHKERRIKNNIYIIIKGKNKLLSEKNKISLVNINYHLSIK
jgi:hypothetical protein